MVICLFNPFSKGSKVIFFLLFLIVFLLSPDVSVLAQDANTLAKNANKELRSSQKMMFSGKLEQARTHLNTASELIEKIKAVDPGLGQLKSLEGKYARQKRDLDKRLIKTGAVKKPEKPGGVDKPDKLPGVVTYRLKKVDRILQKGEGVLTKETAASDDWKVKELESTLNEANDIMAEILEKYGDRIPPDHPDIKTRENKIAAFQSKVNEFKEEVVNKKGIAAKEKGQREAQSQEWLVKINPFITGPAKPGYDATKYLIAGGTENVEELEKRKKIYDEADALFAEYKKVKFPAGKTDELERAEKNLAYALDTFSKGYKASVEGFFKKAEEKLDQAAQWLAKEEAKGEGKKQFLLLQKDIIPDIRKMIATATAPVAGADTRVAALNKKLADIEKRSEKLHELRKNRTFMTPDKFKGKELGEIKSKAAKFLKKEHPDAKILRTTVISNDWKEERVLEHTDTTKTAVRYRITRSVTAQIGGKRGSDVFLYTIYVAKDKRADGSWGKLYGHVMFTDHMLEKNVKK